MKTKNPNAREDRIDRLRMVTENRYCARFERLFDKADAMIGELCRDGRTVFYVFPVGGKYREGDRAGLINFLIRNKYV
jgi:hypothetical protein